MTASAVAPNPTSGQATATPTPPAAATSAPASAAAPAAPTAGTILGEKQTTAAPTQEKPGEGQPAQPGAEIKYELKAPEGSRAIDAEVLKAYETFARELKLPPDAAQKGVNQLAPIVQQRFEKAVNEAHDARVAQWETESHAKYGGEARAANSQAAERTMAKVGTPELRTLLESTGLIKHPEIVGMLIRTGAFLSPDPIVTANGSPPGQATPAPAPAANQNHNDPGFQKRVFYDKVDIK